MPRDAFAGDRKAPMHSPLAAVEKRFIQRWVGTFPSWIETYHLTMLTVLWSGGVLAAGWLARANPRWLWLSSLMLLLQWFTDAFDGALGRQRHTGLVKWGYYMDHLLDFLFISCLLVGYTFLLQGPAHTLMVLLVPLIGAFWVSAFLAFSVTNEFQITQFGLGPTEVRILFILLNSAIIFFGPEAVAGFIPLFLLLVLLLLVLVVYRTHRRVWQMDMQARRDGGEPDGNRVR